MALVQVSSRPELHLSRVELTLYRFDWFFKSRTPEELRRRGATLVLCVMKGKENIDEKEYKPTKGAGGGKKRPIDELKNVTGSRDTTPSIQGKKSVSSSRFADVSVG